MCQWNIIMNYFFSQCSYIVFVWVCAEDGGVQFDNCILDLYIKVTSECFSLMLKHVCKIPFLVPSSCVCTCLRCASSDRRSPWQWPVKESRGHWKWEGVFIWLPEVCSVQHSCPIRLFFLSVLLSFLCFLSLWFNLIQVHTHTSTPTPSSWEVPGDCETHWLIRSQVKHCPGACYRAKVNDVAYKNTSDYCIHSSWFFRIIYTHTLGHICVKAYSLYQTAARPMPPPLGFPHNVCDIMILFPLFDG